MGRRAVTSVLLDTHTWAWALTDNGRLTVNAEKLIRRADKILISPITLFEITQKVRIKKWPEMNAYAGQLLNLLMEQGGQIAELGPEICLLAGQLAWSHRDPFDRMLAATAMHNCVPFISADSVSDQLSGHDGWIARLW